MKQLIIFLFGVTFYEMFEDAIAFIRDPDARVVSQHNYPSGRPMSIREAKRKGLIHNYKHFQKNI
ncbi:MAG: hypothetical protein WC011_01095 [Candidatus Paceibacterota bacterium]